MAKNKKASYGVYQTSGAFVKNKTVKVVRHAKAHPEDAVAQAAAKSIRAKSSRVGYKGPAVAKAKVPRLIAQMDAKVAAATKVYNTIKDQTGVFVLDGKIVKFTPAQLHKLFGRNSSQR